MGVRFEIEFTAEALDQLAALRAFDRAALLDAIDQQLRVEPTIPTRNRRSLRPSQALAQVGITWQLRVGDWRVFYDVVPPTLVVVIRIVRKGTNTTEGALEK